MRFLHLLSALLLLAYTSAIPLSPAGDDVRVLPTAKSSVSSPLASVVPEGTLKLRLALAQSDPDGLIEALYSVSDPDSPRYGQYLSKAEVCHHLTPSLIAHLTHSSRYRSLWRLPPNRSRLSTSGCWPTTSPPPPSRHLGIGSASSYPSEKRTNFSPPTSM